MKIFKPAICYIFGLVFCVFYCALNAFGGWELQNPLPTGSTLINVWGSSSSDVFAVGTGGTILHYNGSAWSKMTVPSGRHEIDGVWGSSGSDVFAVGFGEEYKGTILHYDGNTWSQMTIPGAFYDIDGVWGSSGSDVFAVGFSEYNSTILHYDGNTWSEMTVPGGFFYDIDGIWGSSASDVFAVGSDGKILHYDGNTWSEMTSNVTDWLSGVWGSSANDVFAVGDYGTILHYDGSAWSEMTSNVTDWLSGVWGSSANDVFAVGEYGTILHYDGNTWSKMSSVTDWRLYGVWGSSANDVFAVGDYGTILHYDGSAWSEMTSNVTSVTSDLFGVWVSSASDVFAVGYDQKEEHFTILHYDGSAWSEMTSNVTNWLHGVWGSSASDVFAVGDNGTILHYDGSAWSEMTVPDYYHLSGVWGSSASDVFAVGCYGTILHYDGSTWSKMASNDTSHLYGVWGSSASDVFSVGSGSTILHYNGNTWSKMSSVTDWRLYGVWGSSGSDVFAVGSDGKILHYDGSAWSEMTSNVTSVTSHLFGVWGSSASDVFAVGAYGTILHYDGNTWSEMTNYVGAWFYGVWGSSASDVFAVGSGSTILHYNGSAVETGLIYFPHIDSNGVWETEICVINTSSEQSLSGDLKAYNNSGQEVSSTAVMLAAHARRQIIIGDELPNPSGIGYIIFESESENVCGYTKFYIEGKYRVAVPATSDVNAGDIYLSHIASNADWWTGISILNTTSSSKELTVEFDNGTTKPITIAAKKHQAFTINSLFGGVLQPNINSAVIKNGSGIVGLELFGSSDSSVDNYLSGILLKDETTTHIYYPHIASNSTWWTGIVAYNPSITSCTLTITPFSKDGTSLSSQTIPLAGQEKYIGTIQNLNFPEGTAWFRIVASSPITGFELFGTNDGKQLGGYTGVGISGTDGVFAKNEKDGWTGIAFVNIEGSSVNVTITAYDDSGNIIDTETLNISAYEKVVDVAPNLFSQDISSATYIGYSSDGEVVGFQLNGSSDGMMLDALPGM
jgi:hypothetical protein